ncbi:MAG: hypothetical protein KDB39_19165 [Austwickia sp.]|nr:hypothetical protein [Austwickia sp.]
MSGAPHGSQPPATDRRPPAAAPWTVALAHSVAQRTGPRRLVALLAPRHQAICRESTRVLGIDSCRHVEAAPAGGHFALVSATRVRYPRTDELKVAVLLADQAAQG